MTTVIDMTVMEGLWRKNAFLAQARRRREYLDSISLPAIKKYVKAQLIGLEDKDQVVTIQVGDIANGIMPSHRDLERTRDFFKEVMEGMGLDPKFLVVVPPTINVRTMSVAEIKEAHA